MIQLFNQVLVLLPLMAIPHTATMPPDQPEATSKYIYQLSKPIPAPEITTDTTDAPEAAAWAEQAQKLARDWYPLVTQLLATENYTPRKTLKLIFKKELPVPAYASGGAITINAKWIGQHPDDFGMVIHEMTHIIQAYPRDPKSPGWLVEGIADYIRWWRYEPESRRTPINPQKATYHDSYRTTAAFLAWIVGKYDRNVVRELDLSLRNKSYSDEIFPKVTGKTVDELWEEFIAPMRKPA
jgi:hypothetical protein